MCPEPTPAPLPTPSPIVYWQDGFEGATPLFERGYHASGNNRSQLVTDPASGMNQVVQVDLSRSDETPYRTEVEPDQLPDSGFTDGTNAKLGQAYRFDLRTYLPPGWVHDSKEEMVVQWHENPDFDLGETWRSPPLALYLMGKGTDGRQHYRLRSRWHSDPVNETPSGDFNNVKIDLGDITPDIGRWVAWRFEFRWAYDETGYLKVWKDGLQVVNRVNVPTTYNDREGPYFKFGLYKSPWKDGGSLVNSRTVYFDDLFIGVP